MPDAGGHPTVVNDPNPLSPKQMETLVVWLQLIDDGTVSIYTEGTPERTIRRMFDAVRAMREDSPHHLTQEP